MVRRRTTERERDQSASDSRHDQEKINSDEYENASGIRDEWLDDNMKPGRQSLNEVDIQKNSLEEEDDLHF